MSSALARGIPAIVPNRPALWPMLMKIACALVSRISNRRASNALTAASSTGAVAMPPTVEQGGHMRQAAQVVRSLDVLADRALIIDTPDGAIHARRSDGRSDRVAVVLHGGPGM